MVAAPAYDLGPAALIAGIGAAVALLPLAWWWHRHRHADGRARRHALTVLTLFLTFDLVLFGAFTRLTDSGLGCPDWPGCYGSVSPLGAHGEITQAQAAQPTGPVTHHKAWVEMTHRYLATGVGALITGIAVWAWVARRRDPSARPGWATATFVWVCLQGAFGALTVTMKLYPAIVTAHLLGGLALLALLTAQAEVQRPVPVVLRLSPRLRTAAWIVAGLAVVQITLGGWVSTNYAVLACRDFPTCQGQWWPPMDFEHGFTVLRGLGEGKDGGYLPFAALTAIHVTHRVGAAVVLAALAGLAWALRGTGTPAGRRAAAVLAGIGAWQLASGLSNVILDWPLVAALAHTGGAAALVVALTAVLVRSRAARATLPAAAPAGLRKMPDSLAT